MAEPTRAHLIEPLATQLACDWRQDNRTADLEYAFYDLADDRSHGDDFVAAAAVEVRDALYPANAFPSDQGLVLPFVTEVFRRAETARAAQVPLQCPGAVPAPPSDVFQVCVYDDAGRWRPAPTPPEALGADEGWMHGRSAAGLAAMRAAAAGSPRIVVRNQLDEAVMLVADGIIQFPGDWVQIQRHFHDTASLNTSWSPTVGAPRPAPEGTSRLLEALASSAYEERERLREAHRLLKQREYVTSRERTRASSTPPRRRSR